MNELTQIRKLLIAILEDDSISPMAKIQLRLAHPHIDWAIAAQERKEASNA
jgi:hypothetical protein